MAYATCDDGVKLYFEETGSGFPVIFAHEFAGDYRSWEPQVRHLARRYRSITFNARGYPPSEVPQDPALYSQDRARDDIAAVLDHLDIEAAHVVGLSMGSFAALHFGLRYPSRARSLVIAGCGYGAEPEQRAAFQEEVEATAALFEKHGMEKGGPHYATGPTRLPFQSKDPRGFAEFLRQFQEHSLEGSVRTFLNVQKAAPLPLGLGKRATGLAGSQLDHRRRRGRPGHRRLPLSQALHPGSRTAGPAQERPHH